MESSRLGDGMDGAAAAGGWGKGEIGFTSSSSSASSSVRIHCCRSNISSAHRPSVGETGESHVKSSTSISRRLDRLEWEENEPSVARSVDGPDNDGEGEAEDEDDEDAAGGGIVGADDEGTVDAAAPDDDVGLDVVLVNEDCDTDDTGAAGSAIDGTDNWR